jgi:hypothetical protein
MAPTEFTSLMLDDAPNSALSNRNHDLLLLHHRPDWMSVGEDLINLPKLTVSVQ